MNADGNPIKTPKESNYDVEKNIKLLSSTKIGQNRDVWFTFKFIEMILSAVCLGFHINGALNDDEPQPHIVYFCGTYVTFLVLSLFGQLRMLCGATVPPLIDSIIAVGGSFCFYFAAFATMHLAEEDFHLKYLSDQEESLHVFFLNCKRQSISSLICGSVFLLHAVYVIDSYIIRESKDDIGKLREGKSSPNGPIQLELFYRPWLEKIKFFRYFFQRIETIEAVAIWKRLYREAGDDNLGPGINIYVFEEPIIGKSSITEKPVIEKKDNYIKIPNYVSMTFENEKDSVEEILKRRDMNYDEYDKDLTFGKKNLESNIEQEGSYYAKSEFDMDLMSIDSKQISVHSQFQIEGGSNSYKQQIPFHNHNQFEGGSGGTSSKPNSLNSQLQTEQPSSSKQNSLKSEFETEKASSFKKNSLKSELQTEQPSSSEQNYVKSNNTVGVSKEEALKNELEDEVRRRAERKRDKNTQVTSDSFDSIKFD